MKHGISMLVCMMTAYHSENKPVIILCCIFGTIEAILFTIKTWDK